MEDHPDHPTRARSQTSPRKSAALWTPEDDALLSSLISPDLRICWDDISRHFPNKTTQQVSDRWNKVLNPDILKGSWSQQEDDIIIRWVEEKGPKDWSSLAATIPGRVGKQCRERWVNSLDPDLLRQPWTDAEDRILIDHQKLWGNKWAKISSLLPGRTDNSVKNRWNSSLKRKIERLEKGLDPVLKRGRKPKRLSAPPSATLDDIPRPQFVQVELNVARIPLGDPSAQQPLVQLSPIFWPESPFFMMSPTRMSNRSPGLPMWGFLPSPNITRQQDGHESKDWEETT
jgi:hypothetical protein